MQTVSEKATELGTVKGEGGINWSWYYFTNKESADEFVTYLDGRGLEHRGVYAPHPAPREGIETDKYYGVRWR
jgi:hypothetical protein